MNDNSRVVHLKGLNGIRAIAAMTVVLSHMIQAIGDFGLSHLDSLQIGAFAVTMFFSLSGFLITYLLLLEKQKFGDINIRQFYKRRILRIWPLYFFYLFLSIITLWIYQPEVLPGSLIFYFFLSANVPLIVGTTLPLVFHYWSLAAEEQFYLFWPWIAKKTNSLLKWIVWFVLIMMVLKVIAWLIFKKTGNAMALVAMDVTRFQCMAIGAAGAILFFQGKPEFLKLSFSPVTQVVVWCLIVLIAIDKFNVALIINNEIVAVVTVLLIINVSSNPKTLIRLDGWHFNYLGKISFGIYVYHPMVIFWTVKLLGGQMKGMGRNYRYSIFYFAIISGTMLVAGLSYRFLEKPFLVFKDRFSRILSSGTKNFATNNG